MKNNKKGFTLAELLIVVAIIGVLVAISIPVFTSQLEKAKEATDAANLRSAYAQVISTNLTDGSTTAITVDQEQGVANWTATPNFADNFTVEAPTAASGSWSVAVVTDASGAVTGAKATYTAATE